MRKLVNLFFILILFSDYKLSFASGQEAVAKFWHDRWMESDKTKGQFTPVKINGVCIESKWELADFLVRQDEDGCPEFDTVQGSKKRLSSIEKQVAGGCLDYLYYIKVLSEAGKQRTPLFKAFM